MLSRAHTPRAAACRELHKTKSKWIPLVKQYDKYDKGGTRAALANLVAGLVMLQELASPSTSQVIPQPLADLAGLFGGEERDPIDPFTLYGSTSKKYAIERLDGEKILSRKRGFTVDTCVSSIPAKGDTPNQPREKALSAENGKCSHAEGDSLKSTCAESCKSACSDALEQWKQKTKDESGFLLLDSDKNRLFKSCSRQCTYDCTREGKTYDFSIPYRP